MIWICAAAMGNEKTFFDYCIDVVKCYSQNQNQNQPFRKDNSIQNSTLKVVNLMKGVW